MELEDSDHEWISPERTDNFHEWMQTAVVDIMDDQDEMALVWEDLDIDKACEEEMQVQAPPLHHHSFWIKD